jgi:hypothetical protein
MPDGFYSSRDFILPNQSKPLEQHQAMNALTQQTPMLLQFREWREALRGQGKLAGYKFNLLTDGQAANKTQAPTGLQLRLGVRPQSPLRLVGSAQAPGVEMSWNKVAFGSTAPLRVLNQALRPLDRPWEAPGANVALDESTMTWLTARPLDEQRAAVQLMLMTGRRDLTPFLSGDNSFAEGNVWGARGDFGLSARWKLNTEWTGSQSAEQERVAQAWHWELAGPIAHPWGEADFRAQMSDVDWGYKPFSGVVTSEGQQRDEVVLRQNLALGALSGALGVQWNQVERKESELPAGAGTTLQSETLEGNADLQLRLSPTLSLVSKHRQRVVDDLTDVQRNSMQQSSSDAGVQLRLARSFNVALTAGTVRTERSMLGDDGPVPISLRDENRATVALQRQSSSGNWSLNFTRQMAAQEIDQNVDTSRQSVALEGEQRLSDWLSLRGRMRLAGETDRERDQFLADADRSVEAQLSLRSMGRLSLRLSDWEQRRDVSGNQVTESGTRETGVRYSLGSDKGLGFSFEYSLRQQDALDDQKQWRLGITYR